MYWVLDRQKNTSIILLKKYYFSMFYILYLYSKALLPSYQLEQQQKIGILFMIEYYWDHRDILRPTSIDW